MVTDLGLQDLETEYVGENYIINSRILSPTSRCQKHQFSSSFNIEMNFEAIPDATQMNTIK